jgi:hypothetical protein
VVSVVPIVVVLSVVVPSVVASLVASVDGSVVSFVLVVASPVTLVPSAVSVALVSPVSVGSAPGPEAVGSVASDGGGVTSVVGVELAVDETSLSTNPVSRPEVGSLTVAALSSGQPVTASAIAGIERKTTDSNVRRTICPR